MWYTKGDYNRGRRIQPPEVTQTYLLWYVGYGSIAQGGATQNAFITPGRQGHANLMYFERCLIQPVRETEEGSLDFAYVK